MIEVEFINIYLKLLWLLSLMQLLRNLCNVVHYNILCRLWGLVITTAIKVQTRELRDLLRLHVLIVQLTAGVGPLLVLVGGNTLLPIHLGRALSFRHLPMKRNVPLFLTGALLCVGVCGLYIVPGLEVCISTRKSVGVYVNIDHCAVLSMLLALGISLVQLHLELLLLRVEHLKITVSLWGQLALVVLLPSPNAASRNAIIRLRTGY